MAVEIPLKRKYRTGGKSRQKSGYGGNSRQAKPHRMLSEREKALHLAQPVKIMHLLASGKIRMITVKQQQEENQ